MVRPALKATGIRILGIGRTGGRVRRPGGSRDHAACRCRSSAGTAISVAMDMSEGIIARFRTMGISRASVPTGHILGSTIQTMLGLAVVFGVAVAIGFRPDAVPVERIAASGVLALITLPLTWLSVVLGLVSENTEVASNLPTHSLHRDDARTAPGHGDRQRRPPDRRLVRPHRARRIPLGDEAVQPRPLALIGRLVRTSERPKGPP
jgi:ABC-2 type transporter